MMTKTMVELFTVLLSLGCLSFPSTALLVSSPLALSRATRSSESVTPATSAAVAGGSEDEASAPPGHLRRFYLLRHGQTDMNAAGIIQGSSDVSRLTELGRQQARDAAQGLARLMRESTSDDFPDLPLAAVFVSNVSRALQTAEEVRREWESGEAGLNRDDFSGASTHKRVLDSLREIDLHEWQCRDKKEIAAAHLEEWAAWGRDPARFKLPFSGRLPVVELWDRAQEAWAGVRGAGPGFAVTFEPTVGEKKTAVEAAGAGAGVAADSDGGALGPTQGEPVSVKTWQDADSQRRVLVVAHNALNQALLCTSCGLGPEAFRKYGFKNGGTCEIEWADGEPLARRWRWVLPLKTGWFHVLANPFMNALGAPAMNRAEALAAATMDVGAPCVILVRPRSRTNVGAVARGMLNFGLCELRLVDPFVDHCSEEALAVARGAQAVLHKAKVYPSLEAATKGLALTVAATAANRANDDTGALGGFGLQGMLTGGSGGAGGGGVDSISGIGGETSADYDETSGFAVEGEEEGGGGGGIGGSGKEGGVEDVDEALARLLTLPSYSPRSCADALKEVAARNQKCAFMLGPEGTGLTVWDLKHAQGLVHVPTHPAFSSLNIAAALTILAYESWTARYGDRLSTSQDGQIVADLNMAAPTPPGSLRGGKHTAAAEPIPPRPRFPGAL